MPNNNEHQKMGSKTPMSGSSERKTENHGKHSSGKTGSKMEDSEMNTAGGRKGNFSEKDRGSEREWSPGPTGTADK